MIDAIMAVLTGVLIGFYFSWRMALVCLGCTPFLLITGMMMAKFQQGMSTKAENSHKMANLLAGDAINNYRTVASFANQELIINDYKKLLDEPKRNAIR